MPSRNLSAHHVQVCPPRQLWRQRSRQTGRSFSRTNNSPTSYSPAAVLDSQHTGLLQLSPSRLTGACEACLSIHRRFLLAASSHLLYRLLTMDHTVEPTPTRSNSETSMVKTMQLLKFHRVGPHIIILPAIAELQPQLGQLLQRRLPVQ